MHKRSARSPAGLCRLLWKILHEGIRYEERGPAVSEEAKVRARKMIRELRSLGYHVALLSAPSGSPHDRERFSTLGALARVNTHRHSQETKGCA
jgi:site-specific DNA-cytosine methylase